jgi:hypothetical protein
MVTEVLSSQSIPVATPIQWQPRLLENPKKPEEAVDCVATDGFAFSEN